MAHTADSASDSDLVAEPLCADLLPGWDEEWVIVERDIFRELRIRALEALAERLIAAGDLAMAGSAALRAVSADPLRETARAVLMRVYLAEGNRIQAARQYCSYEELVMEELGVEPSDHLQKLLRA